MSRARSSICAAALAVLSGCRPAHITTVPAVPGEDAGAFEVIVRVARDSERGLPFRVDPRPVSVDAGSELTMPSVIPGSDAVTAARLQVLRQLQMDTVDATVIGLKQSCPGFLTPINEADTATIANGYPGCPRERFYVLGVGIPRPGVDSVLRADLPDTKAMWTVRVMRSRVSPFGADRRVYEYVLERQDQQPWRFVRSFLLYLVE